LPIRNHTFAVSARQPPRFQRAFPTSRLPGSIRLPRGQGVIKRLPRVRWTSTAIIPSDLRNVSTAISSSCKFSCDQGYPSPTAARMLSPLISPSESASLAKLSFRFGKSMGEVTGATSRKLCGCTQPRQFTPLVAALIASSNSIGRSISSPERVKKCGLTQPLRSRSLPQSSKAR
jgi:hypothetical protein